MAPWPTRAGPVPAAMAGQRGAFFARARWNARCFLPPPDRLVCASPAPAARSRLPTHGAAPPRRWGLHDEKQRRFDDADFDFGDRRPGPRRRARSSWPPRWASASGCWPRRTPASRPGAACGSASRPWATTSVRARGDAGAERPRARADARAARPHAEAGRGRAGRAGRRGTARRRRRRGGVGRARRRARHGGRRRRHLLPHQRSRGARSRRGCARPPNTVGARPPTGGSGSSSTGTSQGQRAARARAKPGRARSRRMSPLRRVEGSTWRIVGTNGPCAGPFSLGGSR